ncbi:MAG: anti-sigma factor [Acidimicrobiales bacterium]
MFELNLDHDEWRDLLGAHALDALEGDERVAIEDHVRECPRCRAELAELREAAARLGNAGAPAPDGLWERIAGALEEVPPPLELSRARPRRRAQRALFATAAVLVSGAAAAAIVGLSVRVDRDARQIRALRNVPSAVERLLVEPGTRQVSLRAADGPWSATAVVDGRGNGFVVHTELPPLPAAQTYQLWALRGTDKISLGVLGPQPQVAAFTQVGDAWGYAITAEPAGGVVSTQSAPVVVGPAVH